MQQQINAHNVPIQLNISNYQSLLKFQKKINKTSNTSLHMTVVFTQMADTMIQKKGQSILKNIQKSPSCQQSANNIDLRFKKFKLLGNHLVAVFEPIDKGGTASTHSCQLYENFVKESRRMVRRAADEMEGKGKKSQRTKTQQEETAQAHGQTIYKMDIRAPLPHVSIKNSATKADLQKVNRLLGKSRPQNLEIRLDTLSADPTKATLL